MLQTNLVGLKDRVIDRLQERAFQLQTNPRGVKGRVRIAIRRVDLLVTDEPMRDVENIHLIDILLRLKTQESRRWEFQVRNHDPSFFFGNPFNPSRNGG